MYIGWTRIGILCIKSQAAGSSVPRVVLEPGLLPPHGSCIFRGRPDVKRLHVLESGVEYIQVDDVYGPSVGITSASIPLVGTLSHDRTSLQGLLGNVVSVLPRRKRKWVWGFWRR